jgi:hypothetical protein
VIERAWSIVTWHVVAVAVHDPMFPDQAVNVEPVPALAVSVTSVPVV